MIGRRSATAAPASRPGGAAHPARAAAARRRWRWRARLAAHRRRGPPARSPPAPTRSPPSPAPRRRWRGCRAAADAADPARRAPDQPVTAVVTETAPDFGMTIRRIEPEGDGARRRRSTTPPLPTSCAGSSARGRARPALSVAVEMDRRPDPGIVSATPDRCNGDAHGPHRADRRRAGAALRLRPPPRRAPAPRRRPAWSAPTAPARRSRRWSRCSASPAPPSPSRRSTTPPSTRRWPQAYRDTASDASRGRRRRRRPRRAGRQRRAGRRPARPERRRAGGAADQRAAARGDQGERLRHPHRDPGAPPRRALPRRRHPARGHRARAAALAPLLVSRIKVMAKLDIAEKRLPQDGRVSLRVGGHEVDVRVSTIPSQYGERVVMRLLDRDAARLGLDRLGMSPRDRAAFERLLARPDGILLVTGPTGSGKTTTLYAALGSINDRSRNIMTVEDPIEYSVDGVGQTQVNAAHRPDLRPRPARHPAPGPRRHHGRRDPRPRDRADRRRGGDDRPPRALDAAHQHRRRRGRPADRHGRRALPARADAAPASSRSGWCASSARTARGPTSPPPPTATCSTARSPIGAPLRRAEGCPACHGSGYRGRTGIYEVVDRRPRAGGADPRAAPPRPSSSPMPAASARACDGRRAQDRARASPPSRKSPASSRGALTPMAAFAYRAVDRVGQSPRRACSRPRAPPRRAPDLRARGLLPVEVTASGRRAAGRRRRGSRLRAVRAAASARATSRSSPASSPR